MVQVGDNALIACPESAGFVYSILNFYYIVSRCGLPQGNWSINKSLICSLQVVLIIFISLIDRTVKGEQIRWFQFGWKMKNEKIISSCTNGDV